MPIPNTRSFTFDYPRTVSEVKTRVKVTQRWDPKITEIALGQNIDLVNANPALNEYIAIWDTGAEKTFISQGVINDLGLSVTGFNDIKPAIGPSQRMPAYDVSIYLPNRVGFPDIQVTLGDFGGDVLIGMDIIASGDFALTNLGGKTTFSFRSPPADRIAFNESPPKLGKYDPCFCQSGKQFKFCHWKS